MIESIYIDVAGDRKASRYTQLIERLHNAQQALSSHNAMTNRVRLLHEANVERARTELEAECDRLNRILKHANR